MSQCSHFQSHNSNTALSNVGTLLCQCWLQASCHSNHSKQGFLYFLDFEEVLGAFKRFLQKDFMFDELL